MTHKFLWIYLARQNTDCQVFDGYYSELPYQLFRPETLCRSVTLVAHRFIRHHLHHLRDIQLLD